MEGGQAAGVRNITVKTKERQLHHDQLIKEVNKTSHNLTNVAPFSLGGTVLVGPSLGRGHYET